MKGRVIDQVVGRRLFTTKVRTQFPVNGENGS
jgi:hypothetical protein